MNQDPNMMQQMGPPPKPFISLNVPTPMAMPTVYEGIFNPYECDQLIEFFQDNQQHQKKGQTFGEGAGSICADESPRQVSVINLHEYVSKQVEPDDFVPSVMQKVFGFVEMQNEVTYRFNIDTFAQLELAEYKESQGYSWHTDCGSTEMATCRKLSFSVQLADPDDFDGGELGFAGYIDNGPNYKPLDNNYGSLLKPPLGSVTIFPSFLSHIVMPVTKGTRYSMFGWIHGPRFK